MESQPQSAFRVDRTTCPKDATRGCLLEALTYFFYRLTQPQKNLEERQDGAQRPFHLQFGGREEERAALAFLLSARTLQTRQWWIHTAFSSPTESRRPTRTQ